MSYENVKIGFDRLRGTLSLQIACVQRGAFLCVAQYQLGGERNYVLYIFIRL